MTTDGKLDKDKDVIRIIYHTTPHRGLNIAVAAIKALWDNGYKDKIHFDVYSSFEAYGWPQRDEPFKDIFEEIKKDMDDFFTEIDKAIGRTPEKKKEKK